MHNLINLTSFSGSLCSVDDLIQHSLDNNLDYAIITDDSTLSSSPLFNKKCKDAGIKPINGSLIHVENMGSIVLYAKNKEGFSELSSILSELPKFEMGKKRKINSDTLLKKLKETNNLLLLDGFEGSILDGEIDNEFYSKLIDSIKGYDNVIYAYNNDASQVLKSNFKKLAEKTEYKKIYKTGITRYVNDEDKKAWLSLYLSKGYGRDKTEKTVDYFTGDYSLGNKLAQNPKMGNINEFVNIFSNYDISRSVEFPNLYKNVSIGGREERPLRARVREIWRKKRPTIEQSKIKEYEKRIAHELSVIESLDDTFEQYILFYSSLARGARSKGFEATIRGSAGGSLILWTLGMSKADPMKYNLPFERFLFKGIKGFPDVDLDVSDKKGCIKMLSDHYSDRYFAEITTSSTINKATETIKVALSYYELSGELSDFELNNFNNRMKNLFKYLKKGGDETKLSYLIENNNFWKKEYQNEVSKKIIDDAIRIEGVSVGRSVSVSSSVLSMTPLRSIMPVQDSIIELFSENCEDMGLLKIDILSSMMLNRINKIKKSIYSKWDKVDDNNKKIPLDIYISDPNNVSHLFDYMSKGYTEGVNQIGGEIGKFICKDIRPSNISDLMVVLGLIRMGVNENTRNFPEEYLKYKEGKQNPDKVVYIHNDLKPILEETYGSIIFEEQIMEIAKVIGGFKPNDANDFRKCITKTKDEKSLNTYFKDKFLLGAKNKGYSNSVALSVFDMLSSKINQFNFSKNHSANYAMIALSEMFLKYEYPSEFLSVYMDSTKDENSIRRVNEDFLNVGYKYKKPSTNMLFMKEPETYNYGGTKLITKRFNGLLNKDFINYTESDPDGYSLDEIVLLALPFYSSKTSLLISKAEKEELTNDLKNIIMSGFFDEQYSDLIKRNGDEMSNIILRYSLSCALDYIIDYRTNIENNQNVSLDSKIHLIEMPYKEYDNFKLDCAIKESEILGFSEIYNIHLDNKSTRKPN